MVKIQPNDPRIRYTGRWHVAEAEAVSTANGSYLEFAFAGEEAVLGFDVTACRRPFPRLYVSVDGGARIEVPLDAYIRIAAGEGEHTVRVILKGSVETQQRWKYPPEAKVSLVQLEAEYFLTLPPDDRPVIEFLGDSITEGISIDNDGRYTCWGGCDDMVFWDDSTAGYAWLTAEKLNMRPVIMGYGCLGTTRGGAGDVPPVCESYPWVIDGCPMPDTNAEIIVINHGTNDRGADKALFMEKYAELLTLVRSRNPKAAIIALTPFCGALTEEIRTVVEAFNHTNGDSVQYISTAGWIPPEPLHPTRTGHKTVSENLSAILREKYTGKE